MTSQRTRDRLIQRLEDQGIDNEVVLDVMRRVPRHLFIDEALAPIDREVFLRELEYYDAVHSSGTQHK